MKIKYSFSFKNIILLFIVIFFTLLLLNSLFSGIEGFSSTIPPPIDDSIKVYPNLTPDSMKTTTTTVKSTISPTSAPMSGSQSPSFNPTCTGIGWTDPNPAANGRHFFCDVNGKYLPAGGLCPGNYQNINGVCVDPSSITTPSAFITTPPASITTPPAFITTPSASITTPSASINTPSAPFTPKCNGSGWTDPNPASNGRHFDCDGNGNYLPVGGFCPANYQSINGVCVDPSSITTNPNKQQL